MSMDVRVLDDITARLIRAPQVIAREVELTVVGIALDMEAGVVAHTPVGATGQLRGSITHQISGSGIAMQGRVFSTDVPVKVASVEHGRAPGRMPPLAPIELWVRRKLGGDSAAAYLIARAIGRRGTNGAQMFHKGYEAGLSKAQARIEALRAAIARAL